MDLLYDIELRIIGSAVLGAALCAYLLRVRLFYYGLSMPAWALACRAEPEEHSASSGHFRPLDGLPICAPQSMPISGRAW